MRKENKQDGKKNIGERESLENEKAGQCTLDWAFVCRWLVSVVMSVQVSVALSLCESPGGDNEVCNIQVSGTTGS